MFDSEARDAIASPARRQTRSGFISDETRSRRNVTGSAMRGRKLRPSTTKKSDRGLVMVAPKRCSGAPRLLPPSANSLGALSPVPQQRTDPCHPSKSVAGAPRSSLARGKGQGWSDWADIVIDISAGGEVLKVLRERNESQFPR